MRELIAFVFLVVLIVAGWNQSYRSHLEGLAGSPVRVEPEPAATPPPVAATPRAVVPAVPSSTPEQDRKWMWEKKPGENPLDPAGTPGGKRGR